MNYGSQAPQKLLSVVVNVFRRCTGINYVDLTRQYIRLESLLKPTILFYYLFIFHTVRKQ